MDETLKQIIEEIGQRPMRSSIITAAAMMDSMLGKVLEKHIVNDANKDDIFSFQGCLGTFSSKINMAYALALISKDLYDDIGLDFETPLMDKKQRCHNKCIFCFINYIFYS